MSLCGLKGRIKWNSISSIFKTRLIQERKYKCCLKSMTMMNDHKQRIHQTIHKAKNKTFTLFVAMASKWLKSLTFYSKCFFAFVGNSMPIRPKTIYRVFALMQESFAQTFYQNWFLSEAMKDICSGPLSTENYKLKLSEKTILIFPVIRHCELT